jgi:fatty acid synthase
MNFKIDKLYPPIEFPVSRGTSSISPLIKWDHSQDHYVTKYDSENLNDVELKRVIINLSESKYEHLLGHTIDGRIILPVMGYVFLVWEAFTLLYGKKYTEFAVVLENIELYHAIILDKSSSTELKILINPKSGQFSIFNGITVAASGSISHTENPKLSEKNQRNSSDDCPTLLAEDFYKELRLRGYHYDDEFQSVSEVKMDTSEGKVKWTGKWIPFLDGVLQFRILSTHLRHNFLARSIQKLIIDPKLHMEIVNDLESEDKVLECFRNGYHLRCGGIEIFDINGFLAPKSQHPGIKILLTYKFIPHLPTPVLSFQEAAAFCTDIGVENIQPSNVKIIEIDNNDGKEPQVQLFSNALMNYPTVAAELTYSSAKELDLGNIKVADKSLASYSNCTFIIKSNCLNDAEFLSDASKCLVSGGFIICREDSVTDLKAIQEISANFQLISVIPTAENETLVLLQHTGEKPDYPIRVLRITNSENETYEWLEKLKKIVLSNTVIVYSQNEPFSGILGLVTCIRKEPILKDLQCVFIDDPEAPSFDLNHPFYAKQLKLGLSINVFRYGEWGSYRHLPMIQKNEPPSTSDYLFANILTKGDLSSFRWLKGTIESSNEGEEIVSVKYAALNFRDVLIATGKLAFRVEELDHYGSVCPMGFEFSGVTESGERVMGMTGYGAFATHVKADRRFIFKCPDDWSLQEAATIPIVYLTVYTSFFEIMRIEKGKSILIHAGAGGVGLAAIRVAFAYGLEVFTTVSTEEKRKFLYKIFPQLKEENIGNSRDTSFEDMIMKNTKHRGVDYVLNSLADDKLKASIRCLAPNGHFVEIGLSDIISNSKLDMKYLGNNKTFKNQFF